MKVLMVCLGNICRSPLAQGILEQYSKGAGLSLEVDSAGTGGWHSGEKPDSRSIDIARKYGIDISKQRARKIRGNDIEYFDRIYAMDRSNYIDILALCNSDDEKGKVKMIMDEIYPGRNVSVPDPYYNSDGFEEVYSMLSKAIEKVIFDLNRKEK